MQSATYPATMAHLAQAGALSSQFPTKANLPEEGEGLDGKDASDATRKQVYSVSSNHIEAKGKLIFKIYIKLRLIINKLKLELWLTDKRISGGALRKCMAKPHVSACRGAQKLVQYLWMTRFFAPWIDLHCLSVPSPWSWSPPSPSCPYPVKRGSERAMGG